MITQPPIVKIVVPIPPVDGREESFVLVSSVPIFTFSLASVSPSFNASIAVASTPLGSFLIWYPSGAVVSLKLYVPKSNPFTIKVPSGPVNTSVISPFGLYS